MIEIKPMDQGYTVSCCIHGGPFSPEEKPDVCMAGQEGVPPHPWTDETLAELAKKHGNLTCSPGDPVNHEFLREMTQRYGSCHMLAWEEGKIIGLLPFFPLQVMQLLRKAMGQTPPGVEFGVERPEDVARSLIVRCIMTTRPYFGAASSPSLTSFQPNPKYPDSVTDASGQVRYRTAEEAGARRGVGQKLVKGLIAWARDHGWKRILTNAHADIDYAYGEYGCGGKAFWTKAGFRVVSSQRRPTPDVEGWRAIVETQAREKGLTVDEAWTWCHMTYDL